jgi:anaerobic glycerol-3-phosphate dehydrogenase C subunit
MTLSPQHIAEELRPAIDGDVLADDLNRALYATDASIYQIMPACVVVPRHHRDVVAAVNYARHNGLAIAPRGGGSGLAGESLCAGIILDFSKYMDGILQIEPDERRVRCQPGVILERLNTQLAAEGLWIGPDPASANRATIGGMVGNNSTGAHSIRYGYLDQYVHELQVVLASGEVVTLAAHPTGEATNGPAGELTRQIEALVAEARPLFERCMPRSERNRSGYAIDKVVRGGVTHLGRLICGSEGTLGIVTECVIGLCDRPRHQALLQLHYDSLMRMAEAVPSIVTFGPATCDVMDGVLLGLARGAYPQYRDVLPADVPASLLVEVAEDTGQQVAEKIDAIRAAATTAVAQDVFVEPEQQARVWSARKAAVPLLFRQPGPRQPIPFIEDIAVPVDRLAEYLARLGELLKRHGVPVAYYAHAGHGEIHTRPYLDLHEAADVATMQRVATEACRLAWELGGTISGEHGEGLVRVQFIKEQYGELYPALRRVKEIFDPAGLLNPGKIINDNSEVMTRNLRFQLRARPERVATRLLDWREGELIHEAELCNGNGHCRSLEAQVTMCPIFQVIRDEAASPRAHANLMRAFLTGVLDEGVRSRDDFKRMADYCVNCKMCHLECPSAVNIPKLMLEAKAQYVAARGLTRTEYVLSRSELVSRMNSLFAPLVNPLMRAGWFCNLLEKATGIDRRRQMPRFALGSGHRHLLKRLRARSAEQDEPPMDRVAYFLDLFANYNDHHLADAVLDVLLHNRVEVILPLQKGCGMPAIDYGDLGCGRKYLRYNVEQLAEVVRRGYKIVCSEPTAALTIKEEYLDVQRTPASELVAENTFELCDYLWRLHQQGRLRTDFRPVEATFGYHAPCHLKALGVGYPGESLVKLVPGVRVVHIDQGCCGIAGTFGFQRKNFDVSMSAGSRLLQALADEQIELGLSECSTCKMQMEQGAGKETVHPIKVLAQAYGYGPFRHM